MRIFRFVSIILFTLSTLHFPLKAQFGQMPPFTVSIEAISGTSIPGFHSFAHARSGDKWLFIGGRTNGLHGLNSSGAFPPEYKNDNIFVIDTTTWSYYSASLNQLPYSIADPMRSTNMQYVHDGDYLYMTGGYGWDSIASMFVTFPKLTAVHVDNMINAVINSLPINPHVRSVADTNMAVCGGDMGKIGNDFYLCFGHNFGGRYTDPPTSIFTQVYSDKITKFNIADDGVTLTLSNFTYQVDTTNFHRRDLNVGPVIHPDGTHGLAAFGGVFIKTANLPFLEPISVKPSGASVNMAFQQKMNHYTCALMPVYDSATQKMYTTFFGGISLYDYDPTTGLVVYDSLVPFVSDVTTQTAHPDGTVEETILPLQLPGLIGSNAKFIVNDDIAIYSNEVIHIRNMPNTRVLAGYLFGGIRAQQGNFGSSAANDTIYRIYITPNNNVGITEASGNLSNALIQPNPAAELADIFFHLKKEDHIQIAIHDLAGKQIQSVLSEKMNIGNHKIRVNTGKLKAGIYFCKIRSGNSEQTIRFIVIN